jgi:hypothetical protein
MEAYRYRSLGRKNVFARFLLRAAWPEVGASRTYAPQKNQFLRSPALPNHFLHHTFDRPHHAALFFRGFFAAFFARRLITDPQFG